MRKEVHAVRDFEARFQVLSKVKIYTHASGSTISTSIVKAFDNNASILIILLLLDVDHYL